MRLSLFAVTALCASSLVARADTIYNNLVPSSSTGEVVPATKADAAAFTPTGNYDLTSASAHLAATSSAAATVDFAIYTTSTTADAPSQLLYELGQVTFSSDGVYTRTAGPQDLLVSGTQYWLVLTSTGGPAFGWALLGTSTEETANNYYNPTTSGFADQGPQPLQLAVSGTPVSAVTPEPSSFALLGTGLMGIAGVLRRCFA